MAQMMRAAGNEHLLTRVEYPGAGHLIEPPYMPHFRVTNFRKMDTNEISELCSYTQCHTKKGVEHQHPLAL